MAALQNIVLFVFAVHLVGSEPSSSALENIDSCEDSCDKTYSGHTYENGEQSISCKRGCRFYSIMAFVHNNEDVNGTLADCQSSCEESYTNATDDSSICISGCRSQAFIAQSAASGIEDESEVSILYPLMYMHSVYSNMIDKVYRQFEVTWSLFMEARSGQLIVMRSEPHIVDFVVDIDDIQEALPNADDKTSAYLETNIAGQDNSATPLLNFRASQIRAAQQLDGNLQMDVDEMNHGDWLTCVARKTGIARIVLSFLILACAIVMIWFCLTAAATAPEQNLSINGDLEYLSKLSGKDRFKLLHPQSQVEARPLPIKIRIEQI